MKKNNEIIYYTDELNDEFSGTYFEPNNIDEKYRYSHNFIWNSFSYIIQNILSFPIKYFYAKLKFSHKIIGKEKFKVTKKQGIFIYCNHTQNFFDTFGTSLCVYPKRNFLIVNPENVSIKPFGKLIEMLGAIPLPDTVGASRKFLNEIQKRLNKKNSITIYPEAHIWPYYTKIRKFKNNSFKYPVKFNAPVYSITNTYKKNGKKIQIISYIDGPFYPNKDLNNKESMEDLRNLVYNSMNNNSKKSEFEKIKYIKKEKNMEEIFVFGHKNPDTDSICSAIVKANLERVLGKNTVAVRLGDLNKETEYALKQANMEVPKLVEKLEDGQKVMLVDHCEFDQSADNIENAEILSVTDHHRIANFTTKTPLFYNAKPYGCTNTLLLEEYKANNVEITKEIGMLMLSAIISDSLLLKSPTCTEYDVKAFNELEKIVGVDAREYGLNMLKAGTDLSEFSAKQIISIDAKKLVEKDKSFIVAQVNTIEIDDVLARYDELKAEMEREVSEKNLDIFVLFVTDIINGNSKLVAVGKDVSLIEKAFDKKFDENNAMFLEGVVSRKKQVLPKILGVIA